MQHELPAAADNLNTWFQTSADTRKHGNNHYIPTVQETCTYLQLRLNVDFVHSRGDIKNLIVRAKATGLALAWAYAGECERNF